jgi:hypothetical protein
MDIKDVRFYALVEWLSSEYSIGEAAKSICEAEVTEKNGITTITYSNGCKDCVRFTDDGKIEHLTNMD